MLCNFHVRLMEILATRAGQHCTTLNDAIIKFAAAGQPVGKRLRAQLRKLDMVYKICRHTTPIFLDGVLDSVEALVPDLKIKIQNKDGIPPDKQNPNVMACDFDQNISLHTLPVDASDTIYPECETAERASLDLQSRLTEMNRMIECALEIQNETNAAMQAAEAKLGDLLNKADGSDKVMLANVQDMGGFSPDRCPLASSSLAPVADMKLMPEKRGVEIQDKEGFPPVRCLSLDPCLCSSSSDGDGSDDDDCVLVDDEVTMQLLRRKYPHLRSLT